MGVPHSLYLHIPFCSHRCAYCDFNTYAGQESLIPAYVEAICAEAAHVGRLSPDNLTVHTVFFGGGTPSLLDPRQLGAILKAVRSAFQVAPEAEITLEANPGTVDGAGLRQLRALGINRISFGAQSANGEELQMLERTHSYLDVMETVSAARRAGLKNLNVDLIYGLPEQTLGAWRVTVRRVLDLKPEHISAYALTLEHGTPFAAWVERGRLTAPDADLAADMYEWASGTLESAGYTQYEISNWATTGHGCRHNLQYWRGLPYLGLGAGAHGYASGFRYSNVRRISTFIDRLSGRPSSENETDIGGAKDVARSEPTQSTLNHFPMSPAALDQHRQSTRDDIADFMIMGLRLTRDGISASTFRARFGKDLGAVFGPEIARLHDLGLVDLVRGGAPSVMPPADWEAVRLSRRGRLLGNEVFAQFVD